MATSVQVPLGPLHDVDPGPLGGVLRCTTLSTGPDQIGLCGWADDATVGLFAMNGWRESDVAALLVRARGDIVHR